MLNPYTAHLVQCWLCCASGHVNLHHKVEEPWGLQGWSPHKKCIGTLFLDDFQNNLVLCQLFFQTTVDAMSKSEYIKK